MHHRIGRARRMPASKPPKPKCVVSALNIWPLSVRSAISVLTPGVERLQIDIEDGIAVGDEIGDDMPAGLAGSAGEDDAFA